MAPSIGISSGDISTGSALGTGGGSGPVPSLVEAGSTWAWIGDGLNASAGGVGSGPTNVVHQFQTLVGARLQPVPFPVLARSGSTIFRDISSNRALINPYAVDFVSDQAPDVFVFGSCGANDNLLSTNPGANPASGATSNVYLQDWYDAVNYAYSKFSAYTGKLLVVVATFPSNKAAEVTYRNAVWAAQAAHVAAMTGSDPRVVFAPLTGMLDSNGSYNGCNWSADTTGALWIGAGSISGTTLTVDSTASGSMAVGRILTGVGVIEGTTVLSGAGSTWTVSISQTLTSRTLYGTVQWVHADTRGAGFMAAQVLSAIDAKIASLSDDAAIDLMVAGAYPLMTGSFLDADEGLAGTGGTITGPGITAAGGSGLATSKVITNTTGATGITVEQVATSGGRTKTRVNLAGTASSDGKIMLQDKANISLAGTPGQPFRTGAILRTPPGVVRNYGSDWGNAWGFWGNSAVSIANNVMAAANDLVGVSKLIFNGFPQGTSGTLPNGNSTTFANKRSWAIFVKAGQVLSGAFEVERTFAYKPSNRTRRTMVYLGDRTDSFGNAFVNTNWKMRPTGTISAAAGGTLRAEPGQWNMHGLTEADFAERRFYKGGTAGQAGVGTGTLLGSAMSGSTWTQVYGAGAVTAADLIYLEITDRDGVVWRSTIAVTAT